MNIKIGIGIDTGGTYTDAVAYDFTGKTILGSAKALTTKDNLSIGILRALDGLPPDLLKKAEVVALSTTLATNACVEDRGGNAKLIFFGGDKRILDQHGSSYGLPPAEEICIQECFTKITGEIEREPDWDLFVNDIKQGFADLDGVGIVELHAMRNGAVIEKKAKELFAEKHDIPVTCGYELFSELNSLQRGSSALLNAKLFPVIKEFLHAIKTALSERGIKAVVVIVRSDGSLMSEDFASMSPVETLICGPAASVIGGTRLSDAANCIIVDMGGTTTDIAVVKDHVPVTTNDGVSIGRWKTYVNGLYVKTFGLGGDSAIHYKDGKLFLEEYRIVPLCIAAQKSPSIIDNLRELLKGKNKHLRYLHEHYLLVKDISGSARYTDEEKAFCHALKERPLILTEAAAAVGKTIFDLRVSRLLKEGVVQMCGLTPTDVMHIKKDFEQYSAGASMLAAEYVALNLEISVDELCGLVYDEVKRKIYRNVVKVLLENNDPHYMKAGVSKDVERCIDESYEMAKTGGHEAIFAMRFHTDFSLVGIGAPTHVFLSDVAKMLGTKALVPKYSGVANALGAIVGNVCASHSVELRPNCDGITGFTVFGNGENRFFKTLNEAETFAVSEAKSGAHVEAIRRGAQGNITVTCDLHKMMGHGKDCVIHLGTSATARAVGAIAFSSLGK